MGDLRVRLIVDPMGHPETGALLFSRMNGEQEEFVFALVGNDPDMQNVLAEENSALIFANDSLMTPERKMKALKTFNRIAQTFQGIKILLRHQTV